MRIGHGFDVHKFGGNGPIILGGVKIIYRKGLIAHSDGDVLLHALIDALLGAAALGDIGLLFSDKNSDFKDINSRNLLRIAYDQVIKNGYIISNLDITIIAQVPKMLPYIQDMRKNIANDLSSDINKINIKSTTTEKLGFIGREEGIACEVLALIKSNIYKLSMRK
ncbi:2-C-methyl-D-erythritol 2,4-cyclodiphosphate synthase [Arsenophonus symbiont of Ornithomya chloropus]|uniref:2-C-methyl-D-erythritol 2,4-cyclodiphosphate synthase n=1 Tax=Arsenophonus symbiont of Ornithomya chloropus TaxID=634121 RepID=UPI0032B25F96